MRKYQRKEKEKKRDTKSHQCLIINGDRVRLLILCRNVLEIYGYEKPNKQSSDLIWAFRNSSLFF